MSRIINFEGRKITVPDDATDDEVSQIIGGPSAAPAKQVAAPGGVGSTLVNGAKALVDGVFMPGTADMALNVAKNAPGSAFNLAKNTVTPLLHPVDTAQSLGHTAMGYAEKLIPGQQDDEKYADAVNSHFANRYGGLSNVKNTVETDPFGALADISVPLTLGGMAAERAPGIAGEIGNVARTAGETVNPINIAGRAAAPVANTAGRTVADVIGGLGTHTGGLPIRAAFNAGKEGGMAGDAFTGNLRGQVPIEGVVADARRAVGNLRNARNTQYVADTGSLGIGRGAASGGGGPLDLSPVAQAFADTNDINSFHGVDLSPSTTATRQKLGNVIEEWQTNPSDAFRTVAGGDALKKAIGDVRDSAQYGSPDRVLANRVYGAAHDAITNQVPEYAAVMKNYGDASDNINDIENTLSLNPKANVDTSLRKLQSSLRDNVNTTYGRRADLTQILADNGAPKLIPSLAGQALKPLTPRGMGSLPAASIAGYGLLAHNPALLAALPFTSPRLVGEGAYALGQGAGALNRVPPGAIGSAGLAAAQSGSLADIFRHMAVLR